MQVVLIGSTSSGCNRSLGLRCNSSPDSRGCVLAQRAQAVVTARLTSQAVVTARLVLQGFLHALSLPTDQPHQKSGRMQGWESVLGWWEV